MPYEVPRSKRSLAQNQFEFKLPDDERVYTIPLPQFVPPAILKNIDQMAMLDFFTKYLEREVPDVLTKLEGIDQLQDLLTEWERQGKISLGESESSSPSSTSTKPPSDTSSVE